MAGKPKGSRAKDYDKKRQELLAKFASLVAVQPTSLPSLRTIASELGVTVPTVTHYFGTRDGLVTAYLEHSWHSAREHLHEASLPAGSLEQCVLEKLEGLKEALLDFGVERLHIFGIAEGLDHEVLGPAYLTFFLEPVLQSAEAWLGHYQRQGQIDDDVDLRTAAIALHAPLLTLLLHQQRLGGERVRHADLERFTAHHARRFIGYLKRADEGGLV